MNERDTMRMPTGCEALGVARSQTSMTAPVMNDGPGRKVKNHA